MQFPTWLPREEENYSVQGSVFITTIPLGYQLHYKMMNYPGEPEISEDKKSKTFSWKVKDLPAIATGFGSPGWLGINTVVLTAPSQFELGKYEGDMNSWTSFGKFVYELK